jgi:subtilisin family serine protease
MTKIRISAIFLWICLSVAGTAPPTASAQPAAPWQTTPTAAYVIELDAPAAAEFLMQRQQEGVAAASTAAASTAAATQQYIADLDQVQQGLLPSLARVGAPVLYRTQRVYNGIAVLATRAQADALAALPGVKTLHRVISKTPDTASSVPFLGAPALWQGFDHIPAVRGEGMRIAVIDTGVDYLHVDFGGPGVGYAQNDKTRRGDVPGFPSAKVVAGYDFVGDAYNADPRSATYNPIPAPDPDPMDCYGHGTHVAGIAAGYGVTQAQKPYPGPWDAATDFSNFRIGPGVAPLAQIVALKVFGCSGASDLVDLALEWAVDPDGDGDFSDRVDVINLSLGSPLGDLLDTTTIAANHAAAIGVVVVASAGNTSDYRFVVGSPSNADRAVSVAATQHGTLRASDGAVQRVDTIAAFSSRGPRVGDASLKPDLAAPGAGITSAASGAGALSLSGTSMAAPHVAGALALLRQLHPTWSSEEIKALAMNTAYPLVRSGLSPASTLYAPSRTGAGRIDLPAAARAQSVAYATAQPGRVSLSFGMPEVLDTYTSAQQLRVVNHGEQALAYTLSYFAVTAMPGVTVTLPLTQITAPAGGALDVPVILHADASEMGRATPPSVGESIASGRAWFDEASGHVLLWPSSGVWQALLSGAAATAPSGVAEFAYQPATHTLTYTLTVTGMAPTSVTNITLRAGQLSDPDALLYTLYTSSEGALSFPATGEFPFEAKHELLLAANELSVEISSAEAPAAPIHGQLVAAMPILHAPVHAAPRPVAAMHAAPARVEMKIDAAASITLTGRALLGSSPPTGVMSLANIFQLELQSPNLRPPELPAEAPDLYDAADISHTGIATDFASVGVQDALLHFGVATHEPWSSPNLVRFDVLMDIDGDGAADFRLFNSSREGYMTDALIGDSFVSVLENLRTGRRVIQLPLNGAGPGDLDTRPFQSRVMVLSVRVTDLGLPTGQNVFSYTIKSYHRALGDGTGDVIDRTPPRQFDLAHPALDVTHGGSHALLIDDRDGAGLSLRLDATGYAQQRPGGLLFFHHHNRVEEQVEVINVHFAWPATLSLPFLAR